MIILESGIPDKQMMFINGYFIGASTAATYGCLIYWHGNKNVLSFGWFSANAW